MRFQRVSVLCLALLISTPCLAQTRERKLGPDDAPALAERVAKNLKEKNFGKCMKDLQALMDIVRTEQRAAVLATKPAGIEGFTALPDKEQDAAVPRALAASMGQPINWSYEKEGTRDRIKVSVVANSPLVSMLEASFKMAAMSNKIEVVKYGKHKAMFEKKKDGKSFSLKMIIHSQHLIEITTKGLSEDGVFKMFNQDFVDKVAEVLGGDE